MNFKMKAAVLALALTASMSANAAMTTTQSGDSSLILTLLDTTAGVSATFDLGFSKSTFNQTAPQIWTVSTGNYANAWNSFWTTATAANTQYSVFAGDATGVTAGATSIFTTVASTWSNVSNTTLGNMQASFDTYITANNAQGNHSTVADGASFVTSATGGSAYAGVGPALGGNVAKIGNAGGDTSAVIGTNMNVWNIVRSSSSGLSNATATKLNVGGINPYFNLNSQGALVYAVPEADTYMMLLAGLGLMGFIARRRTAA